MSRTPAPPTPPRPRPRWAALALALLVGLASTALAKLDGPKWQEAEQRLRALVAKPGAPEDKTALVKLVLTDGEPRAWNLLADALVAEAVHVAQVSEARDRELQPLQELLGKKAKYPAEEEEMYRLQKLVGDLERQKADEERVLRQVVAGFGAADEAGRKLVYVKAKTHKDFAVRAAAARVAALFPEEPASRGPLADLLKDVDPRVRLAALEGLEKASGTSWHDGVVARIEDPEWGVQLVAARLAGAREIGKAIPALIRALATCTPRVAEQVVESLRALTGETMEPYADAWAKWWEANRSRWGEDGRPIQPIKGAARPGAETTFYGLKIRSDRVLFVIDTSLSMKEEKKADTPAEPPAPKGPVTGEPAPAQPAPEVAPKFSGPKIDIAKQELRRALKKLPKECSFNIVSFNHGVTQWQAGMVPATEKNKEDAFAWIRDMTPAGSTYIDGALRLGFKMAGLGSYDRAYPDVALDTIILLSDGAPTDNAWPESKPMEPQEILDHVREWNAQRRVVIHCVGIDVVVQGIEFLKKLAAQNGGTYVDG